MYLKDIARKIYEVDTASENRIVTVMIYGSDRIVFKGPAKNLSFATSKFVSNLQDWSVLSFGPDESFEPENSDFPKYNFPLLIKIF